jgi:tetratricopeptide (TPR) repeat protein
MSNVAKLKKQAAEFEQKKQFDKALAVYVKLLDEFDQNADELDVGLFNRVGDMMLRQGNVSEAVDYYERAVDRYADTGFFNNAIALCSKILRHSPGRATVYYKLGRISAQKGLKHDARANFLEYADRMQKAGKFDEAFRALKEFTELCPDQDDFRLVLADQLAKANRKTEAIEQLQVLHERYDAAGRAADATATADRMRALDPSVEPRSAARQTRKRQADDLVFLDLDSPTGAPIDRRTPSYQPITSRPDNNPVIERIVEHLEGGINPSTPSAQIEQIIVNGPQLDVTRAGQNSIGLERTPSEPLLGFELTTINDSDVMPSNTPTSQLSGFEATSLETEPEVGTLTPAETSTPFGASTPAEPSTPPASVSPTASATPAPQWPPVSSSTPAGSSIDVELGDMDVVEPSERPAPLPRQVSPQITHSALDGLPMMDVDDDITNGEAQTDDQIPAVSHHSMFVAQDTVDRLSARVEAEPENWQLRRDLAEAMFEAGDRAAGLRELESAMGGAERAGKLELASTLAEQIARLEPEQVRHQQKRVEFAFRTNDRSRLIDAYLALADVLVRSDLPDKARSIYQRVLNLAPDEPRATVALDTLAGPNIVAPALRRGTPSAAHLALDPTVRPAVPTPISSRAAFVNLGDFLRDDAQPKDTRMVVPEHEPTGDEEADFADMLRKFKQGLAENVEADDYQSHYDLAIAFREMGLIDEAIAEFQKALGSPTNRLATYEALGQCFMDKKQFKLASSILGRALNERASEDQLVGVLYLLGLAAEAQGNPAEALGYYQRVFVVDIQFRDIGERMRAVEQVAQ